MSAVAALMLARETQRIEAQGTHEVFLAKQLELSEAGIDIQSKHIFEFYQTVSTKGKQQKRVECLACGHSFEAAGSTRLVKHFVNCALVPANVKQPFTAIKAPVRPAVEFCNDGEDEPAIAIEDEDTLLLEFNSSPLDELSLDARHSLSTA